MRTTRLIVLIALCACEPAEHKRAEPTSVADPYGEGGGGGGESEGEEQSLGTEPNHEAPIADNIEVGAQLGDRQGVLVDRAHSAACHPGPERPGQPALDVVLESLAVSQPQLQQCYMDARSQHDPDNAGVTIQVQATFAQNGCLERAIIADDPALTTQLTMCLVNVAKGWAIPTYAERSQHRFSLELAP